MSSSYAACLAPRDESRSKATYWLDPLEDARWDTFLLKHNRASLFHSSPWLKALKESYGYEVVACTTSHPEEKLGNAIVFCRVKSWLTGRRLVSLPFSDHCEPLVDSEEDLDVMALGLEQEVSRSRWDYIEIRPLRTTALNTTLSCTTIPYHFHELDLRPPLSVLFQNLHRSCIQRKIRRAERDGLIYREGSSQEFLNHFYRLFILTRRRHKLPPQPKAWFANLVRFFGEALKIRLALNDERPIAAIMTIAYKGTLAYKYACSDSRFNNLGGIHLLLWNAIQDAKAGGLCCLDFGRTDADQQSLITFKNRWGASHSNLTYSRYGDSKRSTHAFDLSATKWKCRAAKYVVSHTPSRIVSKIGQMLYGHIG